jgi:hypothetical protein
MAEIIDFTTRERTEKTEFAKTLLYVAEQSVEFEPANFVVLASGHSCCGGSVEQVYFTVVDRGSLLTLIGMLESAKHEALKILSEMDDAND